MQERPKGPSALDLMLELQETVGLAYLFVSHDMAVIECMSHHVAVMRAGRIVEMGTRFLRILSGPIPGH